MSKHLVFVYGTLRKGAHNSADKFVGAKHISPDTIMGRLFEVSWFPGLSLDGDDTVKGDVFEVTPDQLERLDDYECYPTLYSREKITTGNGHEVFVYTYNTESEEEYDSIPSGDWLEYTEEKEVA